MRNEFTIFAIAAFLVMEFLVWTNVPCCDNPDTRIGATGIAEPFRATGVAYVK